MSSRSLSKDSTNTALCQTSKYVQNVQVVTQRREYRLYPRVPLLRTFGNGTTRVHAGSRSLSSIIPVPQTTQVERAPSIIRQSHRVEDENILMQSSRYEPCSSKSVRFAHNLPLLERGAKSVLRTSHLRGRKYYPHVSQMNIIIRSSILQHSSAAIHETLEEHGRLAERCKQEDLTENRICQRRRGSYHRFSNGNITFFLVV